MKFTTRDAPPVVTISRDLANKMTVSALSLTKGGGSFHRRSLMWSFEENEPRKLVRLINYLTVSSWPDENPYSF